MIGIFDSGSGGLSVFREVFKLLPREKYVYFSDNAHCPYGEKSREQIIARARTITDFLINEGCSIVVVACNTATAAAISTLRDEYSIPFVGMEPAVKPAALATKTGVIGVPSTPTTTDYIPTESLSRSTSAQASSSSWRPEIWTVRKRKPLSVQACSPCWMPAPPGIRWRCSQA